MSNPYFEFKQFTVWHDRCAMKVGTDGVLLGAWVKADNPKRILDIGTGSGLIALMVAQRFESAQVEAIDIVEEAVTQANENFARSPFANRLCAYHIALQEWETKEKYDLIVSNPPYYKNSLVCPNETRSYARHNDMLAFVDLFEHSDRLLAEEGVLAFVIPIEAEAEFIGLAHVHHMEIVRRCRVHTTNKKAAKRTLLEFARMGRDKRMTSREDVNNEALKKEGFDGIFTNKAIATRKGIIETRQNEGVKGHEEIGKGEDEMKSILAEKRQEYIEEKLVLCEEGLPRSTAYQELTKDFYL